MRADRLEREQRIAKLATRQHGVVSHRQLAELGLGRGAVRRWLESGRLHRVHARLYAVGHTRLTVRGRWMAAVLACPDGALLSHGDAGALWELMPIGGRRVHVTVPRAGPRRRNGINVHETARFAVEERAAHHAIPVTSVARTLLDVAETEPHRLPRAWDSAERLRLLDTRAVARVCERGFGRRGLKHLLPLLADRTRVVGDTRQELEARLFELCRRFALPLPSCNVMVEGFLVDASWPPQRLIVELDSWEFHHTRAAFESDRNRDARLQAAGYRVIRITWRRLEEAPAEIAELIRKLLGP